MRKELKKFDKALEDEKQYENFMESTGKKEKPALDFNNLTQRETF